MAEVIKNFKIINLKAGRIACHLFYNDDKCLYKKNGRKGTVQYYRCVGKDELSDEQCSMTGKIVEGYFKITKGGQRHNHPNHESNAEADSIYSEMKLKVNSCSETIETIYRKSTASKTSPVLRKLNFKKIQRCLRDVRRRKFPKCKSISELDSILKSDSLLYEQLGTYRKLPFYRGVIKAHNHEANVFIIDQFINRLSEETEQKIWVDATFNVAPLFSSQLLIIFAEINQMVYPIAFFTMSSKKKALYKAIFKYLRDNFNVNPTKSMTDYEASMRNAIRETWENCLLLGCHFHYKQALRRKVASIFGLRSHISSNTHASKILKFFMNLPLLPQKHIVHGFREILNLQNCHKQTHLFKNFNKYFVKNWLHNLKSYKITDHRTNNIAESFNAKFKRIMNRNPSPFGFLNKLLEIVEEFYGKFLSNHELGVSFKPASKLQQKLYTCREKLAIKEITVLQFLHKITY